MSAAEIEFDQAGAGLLDADQLPLERRACRQVELARGRDAMGRSLPLTDDGQLAGTQAIPPTGPNNVALRLAWLVSVEADGGSAVRVPGQLSAEA